MSREEKRDTATGTTYPDGMVVSDQEIREMVGRLRLSELGAACEVFQLIHEATWSAESGFVDDWSLRVIKQVAGEARRKRLRRLFKAIAREVERGKRGIAAARLTASRALEIMIVFTKFDFMTADQIAGVVRDLARVRVMRSEAYRASIRDRGDPYVEGAAPVNDESVGGNES